jgi:hypothetical protein
MIRDRQLAVSETKCAEKQARHPHLGFTANNSQLLGILRTINPFIVMLYCKGGRQLTLEYHDWAM